jgi:oligogalacturonide transporter
MPLESLWGNNNIGYLNRNKPAPGSLKARAATEFNTQEVK